MPTVTGSNIDAFKQGELERRGMLKGKAGAPAPAASLEAQYGPMDALMIAAGKSTDDNLKQLSMAYHTTRQNVANAMGDKQTAQLHQQRVDEIQQGLDDSDADYRPLAGAYPTATAIGEAFGHSNVGKIGRMLATNPVDTLSGLLSSVAKQVGGNSPQSQSMMQQFLAGTTPLPSSSQSSGGYGDGGIIGKSGGSNL